VSSTDREYQEALARKLRSEAILASHGLPVTGELACFAPASRLRPRSPAEAINRAAAVSCISHRAQLEQLGDLDLFMKEEGIFHFLTDDEKRYYFSPPEPDAPHNAPYTWRIESAHALYWALNHFVRLGYPDAPTDPKTLYHLFFVRGLAEFEAASRLRLPVEILDAADLYFRLLAVCRQRTGEEEGAIGMLAYPIVYERYVALCWLLGKGEWDHLQAHS